MSLEIKHFDCRLNQWIHIDGNLNNPGSILTEKLDNTLLEAYFPEKSFSFGHIDERCTASDLKNHPSGQVLLFSSKTRLLYGDIDCLETIEKLCPDRKDRGAYGSIFLGSCKNALEIKTNILVVDDTTGENGGILPLEVAWKQVGDCHGKIAPQLAKKLTGTSNKVIQYRMGIKDDFRFAKGTFAPKYLGDLDYLSRTIPDIDIIVPTSSFKGGDKKNNPLKPGLYSVNLWLGEKELSSRGKIALSQLHASFPNGIKDFMGDLEKQAEKLAKIQNDVRALAQYYCERYELRMATLVDIRESEAEDTQEEEIDNEDKSENLIYRLIKADLSSGHCQLLETPKIINELQRFLQREWLEIALGKTVNFDRGMIIPSKDLKHGEICVPWIDEGKEVLNFRSPFLNSNGMCVSLNRLVEDSRAPNGNFLEGVIVVNDEDKARIEARIKEQIAIGLSPTEEIPKETESERQGRDYDGDCLGVAEAEKFTDFTEEVKMRNLPENAYAPVKKEEKVSFYRQDGSQPEFEEIAIFMSDSISVGVINNHATAIEALESEIDILDKYGTSQDRENYVRTIAAHYQKLIDEASRQENPKPLPPKYALQIAQILSLANGELNDNSVRQVMQLNRELYHEMVAEAGYQNQLAVDIFKSNRAPNIDSIRNNNRILYRIPNYIRDKKHLGLYGSGNKVINVQGYSPVELMVRQANRYFSESALVSRPPEQFRDLFSSSYNPEQFNKVLAAKKEFDRIFAIALKRNSKSRNERGPVLVGTTALGATIEITNINLFKHPLAFKGEPLNIKLVPNTSGNTYHKLLAFAEVSDQIQNASPVYKPLGTVCEVSREELGLDTGMTSYLGTVILKSPETESQVKLLFRQAYDYARAFCETIPREERKAYAAAAWHISTETMRVSKEEKQKVKKVSNFVYAAFGDELEKQLEEFQLRRLQLTRVKDYAPELLSGEPKEVNFEIFQNADGYTMVMGKEGDELKPLACLSSLSGQLPNGTQGKGVIFADGYATANLEINHPRLNQLITYGKAGDCELSGYKFESGKQYEVRSLTVPSKAIAVIKLNGKLLGELDANSLDILNQLGLHKAGTKFEANLNSYSQGELGYILAELHDGNILKIKLTKTSEIKDRDFQTESVTLQLDIVAPKITHDLGVEVKIDGEWKLAGIFTANQQSSRKALQQAGLWGDRKSFQGSISPNFTVASLEVEADSLKYPQIGEWRTVSFALDTPSNQDSQADRLLNKLKQKPTKLQRLDQTWKLPSGEEKSYQTLGLVVDANLADATQKWLRLKNVPFRRLESNDATVQMETQRGYVVFRMVESDVPESVKNAFFAQCGQPLNANLTDVTTISPYYQHLEQVKEKERLSDDLLTFSVPRIPEFTENELNKLDSVVLDDYQNQGKRFGEVVAPILKDFLDLKDTDSFSGSIYKASWSASTSTLSLFEAQSQDVKMTAILKDDTWQVTTDNLTIQDAEYFAKIAPQVRAKLSQRNAIALKVYEKLVAEVRSSPGFENSSNSEVDLAVAVSLIGKCESETEVLRILSQSPEAKVKNAYNYAEKTYSKARALREHFRATQKLDFGRE